MGVKQEQAAHLTLKICIFLCSQSSSKSTPADISFCKIIYLFRMKLLMKNYPEMNIEKHDEEQNIWKRFQSRLSSKVKIATNLFTTTA